VNDRDLDDEFARIIAGWDAEAPDPLPRRAAAPDADAVPVDADATAPGGATDAAPTDAAPADAAPTAGAGPDEAPTVGAGPAPEGESATPSAATPSASGPGGAPGGVTGSDALDLPIAPTTPHVWRGGTPTRDDSDAAPDEVGSDGADDDHFVPPSEIDLPSAETDPMFWAIVGGLVGGPLLLLYILFFDRDGSGWWVVTALAMIVVGFVLLVLRGGTERDPFDDGTRV
jgi:hypothetical protein